MKKTVFITGASKGLGLQLSQLFLDSGFNVYATARNTSKIKLNGSEDSIKTNTLDITNYSHCEKAINNCIDAFGGIDILINNASSCVGGVSLPDLHWEKINQEVDTTLKGAIYVSKAFLSKLKKQGSGKIIFISSITGLENREGDETYSIYGACKSGLIRFSEMLNQDIRQYGMQSHVIVPCNIRDKDFSKQNAISFKDVFKTIQFLSDTGDNLAINKLTFSPAR